MENMAKAVLMDAPISKKQSVEICSLLRGKTTEKAKAILQNVIDMKEAVPYKFGNDLDTNNYGKCIDSVEYYMARGVDANVLAQILATKARWHLVICQKWGEGSNWSTIKNEILQMGKFPSCVWHNESLSESQKKAMAINLNDPEKLQEFIERRIGLPIHYFEMTKTVSKTVKRGEVIPLPFIADMMINYAKEKIVEPNSSADKGKIVDRAVKVYLACTECLKEVRYSEIDQRDAMRQAILSWCDSRV